MLQSHSVTEGHCVLAVTKERVWRGMERARWQSGPEEGGCLLARLKDGTFVSAGSEKVSCLGAGMHECC